MKEAPEKDGEGRWSYGEGCSKTVQYSPFSQDPLVWCGQGNGTDCLKKKGQRDLRGLDCLIRNSKPVQLLSRWEVLPK